ncbi:uncharacterized protein LOC116348462 [Contarinia nasturtii]|uniref:uncharacterized protein LOC116348397 n=1 Tax=Contarinia nasturtii TaxID=265458 RepID=UPI0012D409DB|nr:uncharacterized protein LOC116348397 [Contarinia nasturtii]XP_031635342.1 uncharacterized protein LOC116348462 [Contarinia nasturtii]
MSNSKLAQVDFSTQLLSRIGKKLYLNTELADVYFVFESKGKPVERVPAHKTFLIAASDVFATMFNGSWIEKKEVKIVDTTAKVFKEFLQFFYLDPVTMTTENVAKVMKLGHRYNVAECLMVCEKFLKRKLDENNNVECYELAVLLEQKKLMESCEKMIGYNAKAVLKSTDFLTCDAKTLSRIVRLNWLSCSEIELFEACMAWIKSTSGEEIVTKQMVQDKLGRIFYDIRFGSMTLKEFASLIPSYGELFSICEHQDIIQMIADDDFQPKMFNGNRAKRCEVDPSKNKVVVKCNRLISSRRSTLPYFIKNLETTTFSINEPAFLNGFFSGFFFENRNNQYFNLKEHLSVKITIVRMPIAEDPSSDGEVVLFEGEQKLGLLAVYVSLPNPILIKPSSMHEIRLELNPPRNCASGLLLKSEVQMDSDFKVQFHDDPILENDPDVSRGLIWNLKFYRI